jgi:dihydrofolate synthase/folylpolyglutamate synthase
VLPKLFGRFEQFTSNIIIDVGHNQLAATAILNQLKYENKKVVLIYNSYEDKEYKKILTILKPIINQLQIIQCDDKRIVSYKKLQRIVNNLSINMVEFDILNLKEDKNYLVFGSFIVVNNFLNKYKEMVDGSKR